jgi:hypothetical protein
MLQRQSVAQIVSPSNGIWGPALWMILHSACEKIGSQQLKKLPQEESRIWLGLLQSLRYSLPCPQCKKHYTAYVAKIPIQHITKDGVRRWLFHLHNHVNQQTGQQEVAEEDLITRYDNSFYFTEFYKIVHDHMLMAVRQGTCSRTDVQRTIRFLIEMKCFYDFF